MPIEKAPRHPVPRHVASSPGSKPYKVRDGDSWDTVARDNGITSRALIQANFRTGDPAEVNWYLRHYVGCTRQTPDHHNWMFSSGDSPGIILIPQTGRIHYSVPMMSQGQNPICWVASATMIASYKGRSSQSLPTLTNGLDPSNTSMPNPATSWADMYARLERLGFVCEDPFPDQTPDPAYIENVLRAHGPWMLSHFTTDLTNAVVGPNTTHAVVITGIDATAGTVWFNNPWGNRDQVSTVSAILVAMERLFARNIRSVCYIP